MREHKDADVTFVLAGVQMVRDYSLMDEGFEWPNKVKLFEAIRENQVSNVVLLSGDVHFANIYHSACSALIGYNLIEYTSSGMSHSIDSFKTPLVREGIESLHDPLYGTARMVTKYNFGEILVDAENRTVHISVKDIDGGSHYDHVINLDTDLIFDERKLSMNRDLCINV